MPRARLLTAGVLIIVVLSCLFLLPALATRALFVGVVFLGALEWARLGGLEDWRIRAIYAASVPLTVLLLTHLVPVAVSAPAALALGCAAWVGAAVWVTVFQWRGRPAATARGAVAFSGWLLMATALAAMLVLRASGPGHVLAFLILVWSADSFAYFGGRRWGRRRLASRVSPGKTWEGLAVALGGTIAVAVAANACWHWTSAPVCAAIAASTFVASVYGDLFESLVKRSRGVKDSGALLPGHGGVLDRIDSLLAAAPTFAAALYALDLK
ncbi:MAG: phosphatidate cytidylyltransferase [Gammaproteobacteria bacterium]